LVLVVVLNFWIRVSSKSLASAYCLRRGSIRPQVLGRVPHLQQEEDSRRPGYLGEFSFKLRTQEDGKICWAAICFSSWLWLDFALSKWSSNLSVQSSEFCFRLRFRWLSSTMTKWNLLFSRASSGNAMAIGRCVKGFGV
jgi:hypothetical protein